MPTRLLAMRAFVTVIALIVALPAAAAGCQATSGESIRPLVELYTSEGCNSCPPADRWLSQQFPPGASRKAIALAFHVDYWDRLGWKDRFASPAYTARQHDVMRANRSTFVYTPQVVLQGRDFTGWRRGSPDSALATAAARPARAVMVATAVPTATAVDVDVTITLDHEPKSSTNLAIAYTDSALSSDVKAGENRGERLRHDHVVRVFETRAIASRSQALRVRLERPREAGAHPTIVAFVQHAASGDVLQALSIPLEGCERRMP